MILQSLQRGLHSTGVGGGETDPKELTQLGDERLRCSEEQLVDALREERVDAAGQLRVHLTVGFGQRL